MPFMIGRAAVRRTAKYLISGSLELRPKVQIFTINYNTFGERHEGIRDFVFWRLPQLQYRNPFVQIATIKNMTPSPFVRCFMTDGEEILIDVENKSHKDILHHLIRVVGKPADVIAAETLARQKKDNPANFGVGCQRPCICEVYGQVPCSGIIALPKHFRGKYQKMASEGSWQSEYIKK